MAGKGRLVQRGTLSALAIAALALAPMPAMAAPAAFQLSEETAPTEPEIELTADSIVHDDLAHTVTARGNLIITYGDVRATADTLVFDTEKRQGALSGNVAIVGPTYSMTAEAARFDLLGRTAELQRFSGRWANRAQLSGDSLTVTDTVITLHQGFITPCLSPEPDLRLGAKAIRYFPRAEFLNLAADEVTLQVFDKTVLALPTFSSTVGREKEVWRSDFLPAFGFDAYRGFLSSTRLDFSLGENSRGTIPVTFSTGRGWSAAVEHFLAVGPGELQNTAQVETPWAVSRGGLRMLNGYRFSTRDGSRWDFAADYRADMNGVAVSRLPEAAWIPPALYWRGVLTVNNELRAGYLWEEQTEVKSYRLRWAAPFTTVIWEPVPRWQTWVSGAAFFNRYADSQFGGGVVTWSHRQPLLPDLAFSQALEVQRLGGETPFAHDRQYDTDRIRLGFDKSWGSRLTTGVSASWSRLRQEGNLAIEDVTIGTTYRWNCFSTTLVLRPLVYGVDLNFALLNF